MLSYINRFLFFVIQELCFTGFLMDEQAQESKLPTTDMAHQHFRFFDLSCLCLFTKRTALGGRNNIFSIN